MSSNLDNFKACGGYDEKDPIERLRFFCSFVLDGDDWLDVETFFDDIINERVELIQNKEVKK